MNFDTIKSRLPEGMTLTILEEASSTNRLLREAAQRTETGEALLLAEEQSEGKGRFDRRFYSPRGTGIYMSLLLRPAMGAECFPLLTPLAGAAVAEATEALSGKSIGIKWVNDIYFEGKKLAGILAEGGFSPAPFVILGIGINAYTPKALPPEIRDTVTSVFGEKNGEDRREALLCEILDRFFAYYRALPSLAFMESYRRRSILIGKRVFVHNAAFDTAKTGEGRAALCLGISETGALLVRYENGEEAALSAGEVTLSL